MDGAPVISQVPQVNANWSTVVPERPETPDTKAPASQVAFHGPPPVPPWAPSMATLASARTVYRNGVTLRSSRTTSRAQRAAIWSMWAPERPANPIATPPGQTSSKGLPPVPPYDALVEMVVGLASPVGHPSSMTPSQSLSAPSQTSVPVRPHPPQFGAAFNGASHPLAGLPSQSPKPGLHAYAHVAATQVATAFA